jgi:hypothetical protein
MADTGRGPARALFWVLVVLTFALTLAARVRGISTHFWMMGDQIRDWRIALGPFAELPLVGPATHVGGYTIGPAFYWILWLIRVVVGPFYENLPHAGGIGQAIIGSAADALLLGAVWRRTASMWAALAVVILVSTSGFDLSLAAVLWNPIIGATCAKIATALVLLEWHRGSLAKRIVLVAVAWVAVHAYTGAIYVTVAVFAALLIDPLTRRDWRTLKRNAAVVGLVIAVLQVPYVLHQISGRFGDRAMGAVTGSLTEVLTGKTPPDFDKSTTGYVGAVTYIQGRPWNPPFIGWLLLVCGGALAIKYRREPGVLIVTLLPPLLAIVGYAIFLGALDHYYYFSLMPSAVLIVVLGLTALPGRAGAAVGIALTAAALVLVPSRLRFAETDNRFPQYGIIVEGSRTVARRDMPMRGIRTEFALRPTVDPVFVYRILGGRIDAASRWMAIIGANGSVTYQDVGGG